MGGYQGKYREPIHFSAKAARSLGRRYSRAIQAARHNFPGSALPGLIVQLFTPPLCYEEHLTPDPTPSSPFSAASPSTLPCTLCWTPDPVAVSYTVRLWNESSKLDFDFSTASNLSCTSLHLSPPLRPSSSGVREWRVAVAGVGPTGEVGGWSEEGRMKVVVPVPPDLAGYPQPGLAPHPCLWLVAGSLAGHLSEGEPVFPEWLDVSGSRHSFTSMQPPRFSRPPQLRGHAAVTFEGSEWMKSQAGFPTFTADVSTVVVVSPRTRGGYEALISVPPHFALFLDQSEVAIHWAPLPLGPRNSTHSLAPSNSTPVILSLLSSNDGLRVHVNGAEVARFSAPLNASTGAVELAGPLLSGDDLRYQGDMAELLIFNHSLSHESHRLIVDYLRGKYFTPIE
jgi:hypothetical protein